MSFKTRFSMAKPSLKASQTGVQIAKQALTQAGLTQKELSVAIGCSRQPITNFLKGEAIAQNLFISICDRLSLDWQAIAHLESVTTPPPETPQIDNLVQKLRQKKYNNIRERCNTLRVLDMSYPIGVNELYTNVNILEQITGRQHKRIDELLLECDFEQFECGLTTVLKECIPAFVAVQKYKKLIVLGKPGAGKTTFLKYLAIQCNEGAFQKDFLPIFVTLKDFAEAENKPSLLEYISSKDGDIESLTTDFYQVFHQGRALVLLDGLDEVRGEDYHRVIKELSDFSLQFWQNQFVLTCRIAAWDYIFEKFTEVEVADFNESQIAIFADKWFKNKPIRAETFLKYLAQHPRIKELAGSPLLLTLVCLAFEESGDLPSSRSELYKEGIDTLLKKWDAKRGIQRDRIYQKLSPQRKENLLSSIALTTFKQKDYFFKTSVVEQYICNYIQNLDRNKTSPEELQLDSSAILKSIEAQHGLLIERAKGIYSFSHLTFQEYFTAREIVFNSPSLAVTLKEIAACVTQKRWREVFLLMSEMLGDASLLLIPMQQNIDRLLAKSERLQEFLQYVRHRAASLEYSCFKPAAVRAFYFDIDFDIDERRSIALTLDRSVNILVCASFLTRMLDEVDFSSAIAMAQNYDATTLEAKIIAAPSADAVMLIAIQIALNSQTLKADGRKTLKSLLHKLKGKTVEDEIKVVADKAREVAKSRHHIGKEWQFTPQEKERLRQYYYATQLLVDCLYSDGCAIDPDLRQKLEETLLLPQAQ